MLINDFLNKYYSDIKTKGLTKDINVPNSMIIQNIDEEWKEWKPVESSINKYDILKIEETYKITLPEQYKEYICSKQFMDIQINEYTVFGINEINTTENIFKTFPENTLKYGFIPIGQINDEDFIALNCHNENIVSFAYSDYSFKKVLFKDFNEFIEFLMEKI